MAAWQFIFYIVPRIEIEKEYGRIPTSVEETFLEEFIGWKDVLSDRLKAILEESFGSERQLSYGPTIFGDEDSSCVKLLFSDVTLEDVTVRLDLRSSVEKQIKGSVSLCKILDGIFITSGFKIVDCSENALIEAIRGSKALEFVKDPQVFLDSLE